jgi:hypothetical protein
MYFCIQFYLYIPPFFVYFLKVKEHKMAEFQDLLAKTVGARPEASPTSAHWDPTKERGEASLPMQRKLIQRKAAALQDQGERAGPQADEVTVETLITGFNQCLEQLTDASKKAAEQLNHAEHIEILKVASGVADTFEDWLQSLDNKQYYRNLRPDIRKLQVQLERALENANAREAEAGERGEPVISDPRIRTLRKKIDAQMNHAAQVTQLAHEHPGLAAMQVVAQAITEVANGFTEITNEHTTLIKAFNEENKDRDDLIDLTQVGIDLTLKQLKWIHEVSSGRPFIYSMMKKWADALEYGLGVSQKRLEILRQREPERGSVPGSERGGEPEAEVPPLPPRPQYPPRTPLDSNDAQVRALQDQLEWVKESAAQAGPEADERQVANLFDHFVKVLGDLRDKEGHTLLMKRALEIDEIIVYLYDLLEYWLLGLEDPRYYHKYFTPKVIRARQSFKDRIAHRSARKGWKGLFAAEHL